jgi:hypothetical protein
MFSPRRLLSLVVLVLVAGGTSLQASAHGRPGGARTEAFRLQADEGRAPSRRALRAGAWHGGVTVAATGESVRVEISDTYAPEAVSAQAWADFFAGLVHADELASVVVRIAPLEEVQQICGPDALGCYGGGVIVMPGAGVSDVTPEMIARHEYGHHVGANRLNPPWQAIDWGTKRWATREGICARVQSGTAMPGDEGSGYTQNPGEAFAEAYRVLNEHRAGLPLTWPIVDGSFVPDDADLAAVEEDVTAPWLRPTVRVYRSGFRAGGPKRWRTTIPTPLDGLVSVVFRLPAGSVHRLRVVAPGGRELGRGTWAGTRVQKVSFPVCGTRATTLVVTRDGPPGPVSLTVTAP